MCKEKAATASGDSCHVDTVEVVVVAMKKLQRTSIWSKAHGAGSHTGPSARSFMAKHCLVLKNFVKKIRVINIDKNNN
jgi:hypothetical protein